MRQAVSHVLSRLAVASMPMTSRPDPTDDRGAGVFSRSRNASISALLRAVGRVVICGKSPLVLVVASLFQFMDARHDPIFQRRAGARKQPLIGVEMGAVVGEQPVQFESAQLAGASRDLLRPVWVIRLAID